MQTIDMSAMYTEELTPEEFLKVYEKERDDIRSATVIPSKLGDETFAKIIVERKTPTYLSKFRRAKGHER